MHGLRLIPVLLAAATLGACNDSTVTTSSGSSEGTGRNTATITQSGSNGTTTITRSSNGSQTIISQSGGERPAN